MELQPGPINAQVMRAAAVTCEHTDQASPQPQGASGRQKLCSATAMSRAGSLDHGGEVNQGWPARHGAKAEADRWLDRSEGAEITAVERGVGGDDGVQILSAVLLPTSVVGAATGADPYQQPTSGKVQQTYPPWRAGQCGGHGPQQPSQQAAASDGERNLQWACLHHPAGA
jgi:hypothetical protein